MNNSTLEKVARAMLYATDWTEAEQWDGTLNAPDPWERLTPDWQAAYLNQARAALLSLRQVDDETVEAMTAAMVEWLDGNVTDQATAGRRAFTAAIDHILTEGGEG